MASAPYPPRHRIQNRSRLAKRTKTLSMGDSNHKGPKDLISTARRGTNPIYGARRTPLGEDGTAARSDSDLRTARHNEKFACGRQRNNSGLTAASSVFRYDGIQKSQSVTNLHVHPRRAQPQKNRLSLLQQPRNRDNRIITQRPMAISNDNLQIREGTVVRRGTVGSRPGQLLLCAWDPIITAKLSNFAIIARLNRRARLGRDGPYRVDCGFCPCNYITLN